MMDGWMDGMIEIQFLFIALLTHAGHTDHFPYNTQIYVFIATWSIHLLSVPHIHYNDGKEANLSNLTKLSEG